LKLIHETPVEQNIPSAICTFGGRVLVGVGSYLRLYDLGKKRLLRKCEMKVPTFVVTIRTEGWRIVVGDAHESTHFIQYRPEDNLFFHFCDDPQTRAVSVLKMVDYDTVIGSDRFGNFWINRVPATVSSEIDNDSVGSVMTSGKQEFLFSAPNKLEKVCEFYLGDTIVSLDRVSPSSASRDLILYTTISGAIGLFIPFTTRSDALFFQTLELHIRSSASSLASRDQLSFRSSYSPVKSVFDGALIEEVESIGSDRLIELARDLDCNPEEIGRKINEIRSVAGL
jgi:splicing factor 3B subunit 3